MEESWLLRDEEAFEVKYVGEIATGKKQVMT
jgi:hypothetical protein